MTDDTTRGASAAAAVVIARARENYLDEETGREGSDAFDYKIKVEGIASFGELYQEVYRLANENYPKVVPGTSHTELDARKARAGDLWAELLPELEEYAADCRAARFTGWSIMSSSPIRRLQGDSPHGEDQAAVDYLERPAPAGEDDPDWGGEDD